MVPLGSASADSDAHEFAATASGVLPCAKAARTTAAAVITNNLVIDSSRKRGPPIRPVR
jgi:hypothetical protein